MLRRVRSIGVALGFAATAVVSVPAAGVAVAVVDNPPVAVITPDGGESGVVGCVPGTEVMFRSDESIDTAEPFDGEPMYQEWEWPGGYDYGYGPTPIRIPCDFEGEIEISLFVRNYFGVDTTTVRMRANEDPVAVISLDGKPLTREPAVAVGSTIVLSGELSSDPEGTPLRYRWDDQIGLVGGELNQPTVKVTCPDYEISIILTLKVTDAQDFTDLQTMGINCTYPATAAFTPAPAGPGKRQKVALGSTITFEADSNLRGGLSWRTTGVPGVASEKRTFTRKFDKPGDFGVELTETSLLGPAKQWAGFTVVAPPTVSVTPAPAGLTDRMTVVAGSKMTFDGSGSRSPGGAALTYAWRTTGKPGVVATATSYTRTFDTPGLFGVELVVTDEVGQTAKRWVGLNVVPAAPPVVKVTPAPADPTGRMKAKVGDTITFDGSGSTSPSGLGLTYAWRTTGLPGVVATTKSYTRKFDKAGLFGVELVVTDSSGQQAKRWVGLSVEP